MTGATSVVIGLPAHSRSWRSLSLPAKLFITLMVVAGLAVLVYGGVHQSSKNIAEFICYLGIAILASRLKVNLPGITGTLSVNFLFILIGVLELSFTETLILGAVSMLAQCMYPERPKAIQVTFNVCAGVGVDGAGVCGVSPSAVDGVGGKPPDSAGCWRQRFTSLRTRDRLRLLSR